MRHPGEDIAASIKAQGAGVVIVSVEPSSKVIALRETRLTEVWDLACETAFDDFRPRILIATFGPQNYGTLERRLEMHLLRTILATSSWCRWVDFENIVTVSDDLSEIKTVCGWLATTNASARIANRGELLTPRMLLAQAARLIDEEIRPDRTNEFR